jgi:hypothetical protein
MYFKKLDYPTFPLLNCFKRVIEEGKIIQNTDHDQYCINTIPGEEDSPNFGRGSLILDWDKSYYDDQKQKMIIPNREKELKEEHFCQLVSAFKNTSFEDMYNYLSNHYILGRVRVMISKPKTCLTWHVDFHKRCLMIIEDKVKHLENDKWYYTDTLNKHTAINASQQDRIHLVATVISDK